MAPSCTHCLTAALCPVCHAEIDHGKNMSKEQRRAEMNDAIVKTLEILASRGKVVLA